MRNKHLLWTRNNIITTLLLPLGHIPFDSSKEPSVIANVISCEAISFQPKGGARFWTFMLSRYVLLKYTLLWCWVFCEALRPLYSIQMQISSFEWLGLILETFERISRGLFRVVIPYSSNYVLWASRASMLHKQRVSIPSLLYSGRLCRCAFRVVDSNPLNCLLASNALLSIRSWPFAPLFSFNHGLQSPGYLWFRANSASISTQG
jgi:hypothetical protein